MKQSDPPFGQLPPWKRRKPGRRATGGKLSAAQIAAARARAEQAGRRYPNLVDNMWAARQSPPAVEQDGSALPPVKDPG